MSSLLVLNSLNPIELMSNIYFFVDATERRKAIELLQDCKEQVILPHLGEKGLEVEVTGLEIMNDDQVHVDLAMVVVIKLFNWCYHADHSKKVAHNRIGQFTIN